MTTRQPAQMSFADQLDAAMLCRFDVRQYGTGQIVVATTGSVRLVYVVIVHDVPGGAVASRDGDPVIAITMPGASSDQLAHLMGAALEAQIDMDVDRHLGDVE